MDNQPKNMETFTVEQFQENFNNLMNEVEAGESFRITSENGTAVIVPYNGGSGVDEIVKMYTDHNEAP